MQKKGAPVGAPFLTNVGLKFWLPTIPTTGFLIKDAVRLEFFLSELYSANSNLSLPYRQAGKNKIMPSILRISLNTRERGRKLCFQL